MGGVRIYRLEKWLINFLLVTLTYFGLFSVIDNKLPMTLNLKSSVAFMQTHIVILHLLKRCF